METLGEYLKSEREKRGLSLKDVCEKTRISMSFLQALENGDYSVIPGEVFVSGFLRSYAKELGLSENEVMARYRESATAAGEVKEGPQVAEEPAGAKEGEGGPAYLKLVYAAVAVILAVILGVFLAGRETPERPVQPTETAPAPVITEVPPAAPAPEERPAAVEEPVPEEAPAGPAAKELSLSIAAAQDTWFSYVADKTRRDSGILKKGEVLLVVADNEIMLDLGNAGGVDIKFNEKTVGPFGPPGSVRRNILFAPDAPGVVTRPRKTVKPEPLDDRTLGAL